MSSQLAVGQMQAAGVKRKLSRMFGSQKCRRNVADLPLLHIIPSVRDSDSDGCSVLWAVGGRLALFRMFWICAGVCSSPCAAWIPIQPSRMAKLGVQKKCHEPLYVY
jgi:hypothetical protein